MKITRFERTPVCVPFLPGILPPPEYQEFNPMYPEPLSQRRQDVLRIHTDAGLSGIGMSSPYFGEREEPAPDEWSGKNPLEFEPRSLRGGGYSMALLDLIGKAVGWPLYRIFGGKAQDRVLVDYWMQRMGPEDSAATARRAAEQGFHGIKIKCKLEDDVTQRIHAIHEAAPNLRIVLDPKERFYSVQQALALARQIEAYDILFEDPIPKDDYEDYRRLKEGTSVLITLHLQNPQQVIKAVNMQAVDGINVAPSDWGFLDMAKIAEAAGLPVWQASNVDNGPFDVFRLHASAAAANCTLGSDMCGNFVHQHSLLARPLVEDGYAVVPDGPGLGIELDEEAVQEYAVG